MKTLHRSSLTITLEEYKQLDDDQMGKCAACGVEREGCEPDAEKYLCEACDTHSVYGPHWWLMTGKVK